MHKKLVSKFRHHNKVLFCGVSLLDQGLPLNADRIKVDDTVGRSAFLLIKHTRPTAGSHFLLDRVNRSVSKGKGAGMQPLCNGSAQFSLKFTFVIAAVAH